MARICRPNSAARRRMLLQASSTGILSRLDARSATSTVDTGSTEIVTGAIPEGLAEMASLLEAILNTSARGHEGIEALRQDLRDRLATGDAGVGATAKFVDALDAISTRQLEDGKAAREGFANILKPPDEHGRTLAARGRTRNLCRARDGSLIRGDIGNATPMFAFTVLPLSDRT